jgi:hypothetical protein
MTATWTRPVPATVEGPLAADAVSVFVATRDGAVRALDVETGRPRWRVDDRPGVVAAGGGLVSVRNEDGTVWAMDSATGSDRWKAASGVRGPLPAVLYKDAVVVAGEGLVVLEAATGQPRWSAPEARASASPLAWGPWLFVGEADGSLRCRRPRDRRRPLELQDGAPAGGTARRRTTTGPSSRAPPTAASSPSIRARRATCAGAGRSAATSRPRRRCPDDTCCFNNHEDVLYALRRGNGHLPGGPPSLRGPLSGPILYGDGILVACFGSRPARRSSSASIRERQAPGRPQGRRGKVRTPPVIVGDVDRDGLRDRAVAALRLGSLEPESLTPGIPSHNIAFETRTALFRPSDRAHNPTSRGVM